MNRDLIQEKIHALSLKERSLITLMIMVVIYAAWDFLVYQPMVAQFTQQQKSIEAKQDAIQTLNTQLQAIVSGPEQKRHKANQERYQDILRELGIAEDKLAEITQNLIAPEAMAGVLKTLLSKSEGLEIQQLEGLGSRPFPEKQAQANEEKNNTNVSDALSSDEATREQQLAQAAAMMELEPDALANYGQAPPTVGQQMMQHFSENNRAGQEPSETRAEDEMGNPHAWRHGLRLAFRGSYLDTLAYLQDLESLGWKFYWERFELNAENYPVVESSLEVFTLSLDEHWLRTSP